MVLVIFWGGVENYPVILRIDKIKRFRWITVLVTIVDIAVAWDFVIFPHEVILLMVQNSQTTT